MGAYGDKIVIRKGIVVLWYTVGFAVWMMHTNSPLSADRLSSVQSGVAYSPETIQRRKVALIGASLFIVICMWGLYPLMKILKLWYHPAKRRRLHE